MPRESLRAVTRSTHPQKKYTALFADGARVHFGGKGCGDFTTYYATQGRAAALRKRAAYLARHAGGGRENWADPKSPGALSRWLLWEQPTLATAVRRYAGHFTYA